jgi:hypothetical protein
MNVLIGYSNPKLSVKDDGCIRNSPQALITERTNIPKSYVYEFPD